MSRSPGALSPVLGLSPSQAALAGNHAARYFPPESIASQRAAVIWRRELPVDLKLVTVINAHGINGIDVTSLTMISRLMRRNKDTVIYLFVGCKARVMRFMLGKAPLEEDVLTGAGTPLGSPKPPATPPIGASGDSTAAAAPAGAAAATTRAAAAGSNAAAHALGDHGGDDYHGEDDYDGGDADRATEAAVPASLVHPESVRMDTFRDGIPISRRASFTTAASGPPEPLTEPAAAAAAAAPIPGTSPLPAPVPVRAHAVAPLAGAALAREDADEAAAAAAQAELAARGLPFVPAPAAVSMVVQSPGALGAAYQQQQQEKRQQQQQLAGPVVSAAAAGTLRVHRVPSSSVIPPISSLLFHDIMNAVVFGKACTLLAAMAKTHAQELEVWRAWRARVDVLTERANAAEAAALGVLDAVAIAAGSSTAIGGGGSRGGGGGGERERATEDGTTDDGGAEVHSLSRRAPSVSAPSGSKAASKGVSSGAAAGAGAALGSGSGSGGRPRGDSISRHSRVPGGAGNGRSQSRGRRASRHTELEEEEDEDGDEHISPAAAAEALARLLAEEPPVTAAGLAAPLLPMSDWSDDDVLAYLQVAMVEGEALEVVRLKADQARARMARVQRRARAAAKAAARGVPLSADRRAAGAGDDDGLDGVDDSDSDHY
jgi:hypothetical protein